MSLTKLFLWTETINELISFEMRSLTDLAKVEYLLIKDTFNLLQEKICSRFLQLKVSSNYSVFISPNAGKYGPEKLRIPTLFT